MPEPDSGAIARFTGWRAFILRSLLVSSLVPSQPPPPTPTPPTHTTTMPRRSGASPTCSARPGALSDRPTSGTTCARPRGAAALRRRRPRPPGPPPGSTSTFWCRRARQGLGAPGAALGRGGPGGRVAEGLQELQLLLLELQRLQLGAGRANRPPKPEGYPSDVRGTCLGCLQIFVPVYDVAGAQEMSSVLWNTPDVLQASPGRAGSACPLAAAKRCSRDPASAACQVCRLGPPIVAPHS